MSGWNGNGFGFVDVSAYCPCKAAEQEQPLAYQSRCYGGPNNNVISKFMEYSCAGIASSRFSLSGSKSCKMLPPLSEVVSAWQEGGESLGGGGCLETNLSFKCHSPSVTEAYTI